MKREKINKQQNINLGTKKLAPKKSFGQNFLTSGKAVSEMIKAGEVGAGDLVLEIGPGKGALTKELLRAGAKVLAVEKDKELIEFLKEEFKVEIEKEKLILIDGDVLSVEFDTKLEKILMDKVNFSPSLGGGQGEVRYKLVANIPYYITGAIIEKFLSKDHKPSLMTVLVQKEVAERVIAKDKKESILSLAVKFYGEPRLTYRVSAGSFFPKPKVGSAILQIKIREGAVYKKLEETYFKIVKAAFAHKRKMMISNLKKEFRTQNDKSINWEGLFLKLNLNAKWRAEDLNVKTFLNIAEEVMRVRR